MESRSERIETFLCKQAIVRHEGLLFECVACKKEFCLNRIRKPIESEKHKQRLPDFLYEVDF